MSTICPWDGRDAAESGRSQQCHAGRGSGGRCHCLWVWATPLTVTSCVDPSGLAPVEYRPLSLDAPAPAFHEVLTPVSHQLAGGAGTVDSIAPGQGIRAWGGEVQGL